MKNILILFSIITFTACNNNSKEGTGDKEPNDTSAQIVNIPATPDTVTEAATKLFKGAWFDVSYPANFTVKPSLISATNKEAYESAFFTSPGGDIVFYVFSPQWSGKATDIALKAGERIISQDSSYHEKEQKKMKNWTIEADDKSYRRSYQEISIDPNINWIFGIEYKNEAAYAKYKSEYLAFKNSLKQYGD